MTLDVAVVQFMCSAHQGPVSWDTRDKCLRANIEPVQCPAARVALAWWHEGCPLLKGRLFLMASAPGKAHPTFIQLAGIYEAQPVPGPRISVWVAW